MKEYFSPALVEYGNVTKLTRNGPGFCHYDDPDNEIWTGGCPEDDDDDDDDD